MKTTIIASKTARAFVRQAILALFLTAVTGQAMAQEEPLKIAFLDMATALFNSDKAKAVNEQLTTETAADQEKVRSLASEATALQEQLQKDAAVLSDDEKRKINDQIQEIGVQYQFLVQKIQTLLQERRQQFQETYAPNLIQAITEVVEEEEYDIVFRAEAALQFGSALDITARVTEKLNEQP